MKFNIKLSCVVLLFLYKSTNEGTYALTNGLFAEQDEMYTVSIQIRRVHECTGTIIASFWAISPAACLTKDETSHYTVVYNTQKLLQGASVPSTKLKNVVDKTVKLRGTGRHRQIYDVGLVKVDSEFPIILVPSILVPSNRVVIPLPTQATLVGWDDYWYNDDPIILMTKANIAVSTHHASNRLNIDLSQNRLNERDIGGPLVYNKILIGMVYQTNRDSVIKISNHYKWIAELAGLQTE